MIASFLRLDNSADTKLKHFPPQKKKQVWILGSHLHIPSGHR